MFSRKERPPQGSSLSDPNFTLNFSSGRPMPCTDSPPTASTQSMSLCCDSCPEETRGFTCLPKHLPFCAFSSRTRVGLFLTTN